MDDAVPGRDDAGTEVGDEAGMPFGGLGGAFVGLLTAGFAGVLSAAGWSFEVRSSCGVAVAGRPAVDC